MKEHRVFIESGQLDEYDTSFKRDSFDRLYLSERKTLSDLLPKVGSIIDVGCLAGDLYTAIKTYDVEYVGIDIDEAAIVAGTARHPDATFHCVDFMAPDCAVEPKELVTAFNLFDHYPDWKLALRSLRRLASRFINISVNMTLDHPTVVDEDVSFLYYGNRTRPILWAIHNIHQLAAYAATENVGATAIEVFGYHKFNMNSIASMANHVTPIDPRELITGNVVITVDGKGAMAQTGKRPDLKITIDNNVVFDSPWKT